MISTDALNARDLYLVCKYEISFANSSKNTNFEGVTVQSFEFAKSIKQSCIKRSDQWGFSLPGRLEYKISDLHTADCVYYHSCCVNFCTGKQVMVHSSVELC